MPPPPPVQARGPSQVPGQQMMMGGATHGEFMPPPFKLPTGGMDAAMAPKPDPGEPQAMDLGSRPGSMSAFMDANAHGGVMPMGGEMGQHAGAAPMGGLTFGQQPDAAMGGGPFGAAAPQPMGAPQQQMGGHAPFGGAPPVFGVGGEQPIPGAFGSS